uniref:Host specificity protein B n=1 Tax=Aeromonas phage vB_AdhaP_MF TaxID=3367373 RepID=A0AB74UQ65_9CAUD
MGKGVKKITGAISKGVGAITGSNAAKKAAQEQAQMMDRQTQFEREQAAKAAEQAQLQARSQQSQIESGIERDKAIAKAEEERKRASEGSSDEVDVDLAAEGEVDADGRRINTREKFMSKRSGSSGLRI